MLQMESQDWVKCLNNSISYLLIFKFYDFMLILNALNVISSILKGFQFQIRNCCKLRSITIISF